MIDVLRQRDFFTFWVAALISGLGDFILIAALPYYVYATSGSTLASALALATEIAPMIVFANLGGVYADRWKRKRVMIGGDVLRGGTLLPLLAVHGSSTLWIVYLAGFTRSCIGNFAGPFGGAAIPHIISRERLPAGNAAFSVATWIGVLVGSPIGGWLLQTSGLTGVALADAASFVLAGLLVATVRAPFQSENKRSPIRQSPKQAWRDWLETAVITIREPWLRLLMTFLLFAGIANAVWGTVRAPFIRHVLSGSATFFSLNLTAQGVGGIAAALVSSCVNRRLSGVRILSLSLVVLGVTTIVVGVAVDDAVTLVASFISGLAILFLLTSLVTLVQSGPPDRLRGRIYGLYLSITGFSSVIGAGLGGWLPTVTSIRLTWTVAGVATTLIGCSAALSLIQPKESEEDQAARVSATIVSL